ncbi:MAG TPA: ABC transporter permease subunit/CPBP intramembrane protease [Acidobacteriota bacterium]|nr:ABC transporter permease subunit/CPBP intramembrane protease [Acidobacteriota bacterium]
MRLSQIKTIFLKEALDTLRDRRTIIMMVIVPVLLYPGIMLFLSEVGSAQRAKMESKTVTVALMNVPADSPLRRLLQSEPKVRIAETSSPIQDVQDGKVQYVIQMPSDMTDRLKLNQTADVKLHYDRSNDDAEVNLARVTKVINSYGDQVLDERIKQKNLPDEYFKPINIEEVNVASKQKMGGFVLSRFLPMLMVLMVLIGSMYSAIDMTAGEKERGTLETILTSPATRTEIVLGKFITVVLAALITGLLNMGSMLATFMFGIFKGASESLQINIPPHIMLIMVLCLIPLAVFFGGLMMTLACFARSFKEAQTLVTPFYIVATLPAMVAIIPGIQLEGFWLTMPIANVTLLFKELMVGTFDPGHILIVLFCVVFLACVAVFLSIKLFGREEVLFGDASSFGLAFKRANISAKTFPEPSESLFFAMLSLALLLYVGVPLQTSDMIRGVVITEVGLFLAFPLAFASYMKLDLRETFRLRGSAPRWILMAFLLFGAIVCLAPELLYFQLKVFPMPQEMIDLGERLSALMLKYSFPATFLFIALMPAICEEMTFRGMIFSGLMTRFKPWTAILVTAFLFGIFHLSIYRFLPVFLIGTAAGFLVWRSNSILTGMLLHMLVNGSVAFLIHYPKYDKFGLLTAKFSLPLTAVGLALIGLAAWVSQKDTKTPS